MTVLKIYIDEKTEDRLRRAAVETGRDMEDLAHSLVADGMLKWEQSQNGEAKPRAPLTLGVLAGKLSHAFIELETYPGVKVLTQNPTRGTGTLELDGEPYFYKFITSVDAARGQIVDRVISLPSYLFMPPADRSRVDAFLRVRIRG